MSEKISIDRRELLVAAGAVAAVVYLPMAAAAARPVGASTPRQSLTDWHIDDMWGVYPRPSEAIGFAPPRDEPVHVAAHHPVDAAYLA